VHKGFGNVEDRAKGADLYDHDYDFDEMNHEIATMFGGGA